MRAKRFYVAGRVQGVFYRASTREQALRLGISGYAKNLPDGRVEVLALGSTHAIDALEKWLWQGPPASQVTEVAIVEVEIGTLRDTTEGFVTH